MRTSTFKILCGIQTLNSLLSSLRTSINTILAEWLRIVVYPYIASPCFLIYKSFEELAWAVYF